MLSEILTNIIGPVVVAVLISVPSYLVGRRKNAAEVSKLLAEKGASEASAAAVVAQAAAEIVGPLLERMRSLQEEVNSLRQLNKQLNVRIAELEDLVRDFLPKGK